MPSVITEIVLGFLLIFSCISYGGVTSFSLAIVGSTIALIALVWVIDMIRNRELVFVKTGLLLPLSLFLSVVILQLIPLPAVILKVISPSTAYLYGQLLSFTPGTLLTITISRENTIMELFKVLSYSGIFLLVLNRIETRKQFDWIIKFIIVLGLAISIFGIIQKYTYSDRIYWFDPPGSADNAVFGPFTNRNNFAGYINMVIPLAIGYFLTDISLAKKLLYGFSVVIMCLALFLSLSRGGMLIFVITLLFIIFASRLKTNLRTKANTMSMWLLFLILFIVLFKEVKFGWQRLSTLFHKDVFVALGHGYSWLDILRIWKDFPLFGTGLGTFGSISSMYKTTPMQALFSYAHNDYLQMLAEVGLIGFISLLLFFVLYFRAILDIWLKRNDHYVVCLVLGGSASLFAMMIYSFLDFNLHIPANALLFFVISGLVYRLAHTRFKNARPILR